MDGSLVQRLAENVINLDYTAAPFKKALEYNVKATPTCNPGESLSRRTVIVGRFAIGGGGVVELPAVSA